jgi:hypothetical protein
VNFPIQPGKEVSDRFLQAKIHDFSSALMYIQDLPYCRNSLRDHATVVLDEKCGTCSTKHAILKRLADENGKDLKLFIGIYRMNAANAKSVQSVLEKHQLDYIPEAHTYLKMGTQVIDVTKRSFANTLFLHDLIEEEEIAPSRWAIIKLKSTRRL